MAEIETTIKLSEMFFGTEAEADDALERLGITLIPDLAFTLSVDGIGEVSRRFGVLGNIYTVEAPRDAALLEALRQILDSDENEKVAGRMRAGKLKHTPVNKRTLRRFGGSLVEHGLHLPLAFKPMNFDFAARLNRIHMKKPFGFEAFYNQRVQVTGDSVELGRLFSLPIEGVAQGTWAETIFDDMLDEDIGLLVEADAVLK